MQLTLSSIYDPLGFGVPFLFQGKRILQHLLYCILLMFIHQPSIPEVIAPILRAEFEKCTINDTSLATVTYKGKQNTQSCWFCGNSRHPRNKCPAKDAACHKRKKLDTMKNFVDLQMCLLLYQDLVQYMMRITFFPVYLPVNHTFMKITCLPAYLPVNHTFE